jgi:glutamate-ammonia-ligase adenylyltransferase
MALTRLCEVHPGLDSRLAADDDLRSNIIAVVGASRDLTQLCLTDPLAIEVLASLDHRRPVDASAVAGLVRWKALEYLRIAARDLGGLDPLEEVGAALALMADDVLSEAWAMAGSDSAGLAVIAMGKLGGRELNYASDVDLLFVGAGDVRRLLDVARRCFRVDIDLRPEGRDGPLVRSLEAYETYWRRWAQTWEFQSLLKTRPVAGNQQLQQAFAEAASTHVWGRTFGADDLRQVRAMKARAEGEIRRKGLTEREIKRGRGGLRDIEFAVQLLQLVHGRHDPALRSPTTLAALNDLAVAGYVDAGDADKLAGAYRFLRTVEHRLQLADGAQIHALPTEVGALERLARVLGYRDARQENAVGQFLADVRHHQSVARNIHEQLFFRPLLELFAGVSVELSPEAAITRLAAFGFTDAARTRQALRELTSGLTRSSRMMQQLLPLLLGWLSESPNPDDGLLGLRTLLASPHRAAMVVGAFRDSPEAARRTCLLLGTSRIVANGLEHHPELVTELADLALEPARGATSPAPPSPVVSSMPLPPTPRGPALPMPAAMKNPRLAEQVKAAVDWRTRTDAKVETLRRIKNGEELRIATFDILGAEGQGDVEQVESELTVLAEISLQAALDILRPPVPMAIVALGRFGGAELSYASDLDVLLVHGASEPSDVTAAEATAEELLRVVKGSTPASRLYLLDADLRPEGKNGPLARSLAGYEGYYARWAQTWERQALLRARPVAGDRALGEQFMDIAGRFVWRPLAEAEEREILRMKARIERERIPSRDDPDFHLKLGRGSLSDVEWTVQLLQLKHGIEAPGTMVALRHLLSAGALAAHDAAALTEAYRFCERTRNRLYLVRGAPGDALPSRPDQLTHLARSLGFTSAELREHYRKVTRRAREVTERLFYGSAAPVRRIQRNWQ